MNVAANLLRQLPRVDRTLEHPALAGLDVRREVIRREVVAAIEAERARVLAAVEAGQTPSPPIADLDHLAAAVRARLDAWLQPHPVPVLNATGVLLHTNLGRAPLSGEAIAAAVAAAGTSELELELVSGKRGSRLAWIGPALASLFEADDALVVNNGAAALLLACSALGAPGGVALSRGQHVEIGDGFRVADMAAAGGVPVRAIGSTNRTHLRDYEAALADGAGALLWVHRSNFELQGFCAEVELAGLGELALARGVPLIADLGSGLVDADALALPGAGGRPEPSVVEYLRAGASIVSFSGDKLLGGPQAGLLVGERSAIARCRRHPLARALRCGKLALAALHATVVAHLRAGPPALPLARMLAVTPDELRGRGERLCDALAWPRTCVQDSTATVGGGSVPGSELTSVALVPEVASASAAAAQLRASQPSMLARVRADRLWIDLRTLVDVDDATLLAVLRPLG